MRTLFEDVTGLPGRGRRLSVMPLSAALHAAAIGGVALFPLLGPGDLPAPPPPTHGPILDVFARHPPTGGGTARRVRAADATRPIPPPRPNPAFVPPAEVPADIPDDPGLDVPETAGPIGFGVPCGADCGGGVGPGPGEAVGPGGGETGPPVAPVRAGYEIQEPRKLVHADPVYPHLARMAGLGGTVILECTLNSEGRVVDIRVLRGHPLFDAAAVEAVRQWVYSPTTLNGRPVAVVMSVTVRFVPKSSTSRSTRKP